jgi:serine/threonine protein kinase
LIPPKYKEFLDLLKKMLIIDPKRRITCSEALEHKFFKMRNIAKGC